MTHYARMTLTFALVAAFSGVFDVQAAPPAPKPPPPAITVSSLYYVSATQRVYVALRNTDPSGRTIVGAKLNVEWVDAAGTVLGTDALIAANFTLPPKRSYLHIWSKGFNTHGAKKLRLVDVQPTYQLPTP